MDAGSSSVWAHLTAESSGLGVLWPAPVSLDIPLGLIKLKVNIFLPVRHAAMPGHWSWWVLELFEEGGRVPRPGCREEHDQWLVADTQLRCLSNYSPNSEKQQFPFCEKKVLMPTNRAVATSQVAAHDPNICCNRVIEEKSDKVWLASKSLLC